MRIMLSLRLVVWVMLLSFSVSVSSANRAPVKISELDFQDITVGDALRILSKQAGLNIISSKAAAEIKMTMYLRDIAPRDVLEAMAKTYNLWYQEDKKSKVIRIYTVREFRLGKVDYRNEKTEIFTFKHQRTSLDFAYMVRDLFGYERVQFSRGADENDVTDDLYDRMERFDIIAKNTYNQSSSGGGGNFGISSSGGGSNSSGGNNSNNSQNSSRSSSQNGQNNQMNLRRGQSLDLLKMLPETESQAMLSGKFSGSTGALNELIEHISPIYVTLIRRQNRVLIRTRDKDAMKDIRVLYKELNIDMATLLLEVKVLELSLNDGYESSFDFSVKAGDFQVTKGDDSFVGAASNVSDLVRAGLGDPAMVAAVASKNFDARLMLMEKEGRITALATPMLTTSNQEVSRIFIGEERPITTSISVTCPEIAQQTGTIGVPTNQSVCIQTPDTEVRSIGKTLLLTPNISADGTVDIRILVEDSSVCPSCGQIPQSDGNGGVNNYNVDTVNTQTFSGDIIAKNGQMIAVGGLINEKSEDSEKKVPILGDIPYLGFFFSDTIKVRKRTEMVILIRPYVMSNGHAEADVNKTWLEENSVHPSADKLNTLGIYKNSEHLDRGFEVQENYKIYKGQDSFDDHHEKGKGAKAVFIPKDERQALYMDLTQYAAQTVKIPKHMRPPETGIIDIPLRLANQNVKVLKNSQLTVKPMGSWRKAGTYVTALQISNKSNKVLPVNYRALNGRWLASTVEKESLAANESTYLYVISANSFEQSLGR